MIKKLVKYGNSQALVLDKALLEILGIAENSKLKLSTDGTSLTITPIHETADTQVLPVSFAEGEAAMHWHGMQMQKSCSLTATMEPAKFQAIMDETRAVMDRYNKEYNYFQRCMTLHTDATYKAECSALGERAYSTGMSMEDYAAEHSKILQRILPDIPMGEMQAEIAAIHKKYEVQKS